MDRSDPEERPRGLPGSARVGAPLANLEAADFCKEGFVYQMGRPPVRVDILMSIAGVRFADAWRGRVAADFDGVPTQIIARRDLIASKRAVGRPQDLIDVASLIEGDRSNEGPSRGPEPPKRKRSKGRDQDAGGS